jgi:hypothetical protein
VYTPCEYGQCFRRFGGICWGSILKTKATGTSETTAALSTSTKKELPSTVNHRESLKLEIMSNKTQIVNGRKFPLRFTQWSIHRGHPCKTCKRYISERERKLCISVLSVVPVMSLNAALMHGFLERSFVVGVETIRAPSSWPLHLTIHGAL